MNRDLNKLTPEFKRKVELLLEKNPEIYITEGWRSYARQLALYAQGRSKVGSIVTWTLKSRHQLGQACDIAFRGKEMYPKDWSKWRKVADSAKDLGIDWGEDLWKIDRAHFQDDFTPLNPSLMQYPKWIEENIDGMKKAEITTNPETKAGDMPAYQLFGFIVKTVKYVLRLK